MSTLADALRAKFGHGVADASSDPGSYYGSMTMQPQTNDAQFMPSMEQPQGYANLFQQITQSPQAQSLLSMIAGKPDAPVGHLPGAKSPLVSLIMGPQAAMIPSNGPDRWTAPQPMQRPVRPDSIVIQKGDTLTALAKRYGVTVDYLAKKNGIKNANRIKAGATLSL